jgi:hypothetical protein
LTHFFNHPKHPESNGWGRYQGQVNKLASPKEVSYGK